MPTNFKKEGNPEKCCVKQTRWRPAKVMRTLAVLWCSKGTWEPSGSPRGHNFLYMCVCAHIYLHASLRVCVRVRARTHGDNSVKLVFLKFAQYHLYLSHKLLIMHSKVTSNYESTFLSCPQIDTDNEKFNLLFQHHNLHDPVSPSPLSYLQLSSILVPAFCNVHTYNDNKHEFCYLVAKWDTKHPHTHMKNSQWSNGNCSNLWGLQFTGIDPSLKHSYKVVTLSQDSRKIALQASNCSVAIRDKNMTGNKTKWK